jgi:hypothetical protein
MVCGAAAGNDIDQRSHVQATKGWELYSWQDGTQWRFALLSGTNWLKFCSIVMNPKAILTLAQLDQQLNKLAEGDTVFWFDHPPGRLPGNCAFALPPPPIVEHIQQTCQRLSLKCKE